MEAFGLTLKRFRRKQGITQEQLADLMGVSRNTIVNWETRKPPNREDVLHLAQVLYLDEGEKDELLSAAGYSSTYQMRKPGRCDYYAHISLPRNYVERPEILTVVRTILLSNAPTIALTSAVQAAKPNTLHGMGGIGKSVIARALCDNIDIQAAFPDGILWVTLGKTPELVPKMREWVTVLGGTISQNTPTVSILRDILAKLLKDRACLLILDNVWKRTDAEAFLVGGSHCRFLLTTRDAEIARELAAKVQPIPLMAESEAVALLEEWADGHLGEVTRMLEEQIVKRLGYLPLAIKLAGAQLQRKAPDEWLQSFTIRKLKSLRPETIHDDLVLTFEQSLEDLDEKKRRLYIALAIFKGDEATVQVGIDRLWQGLGGLDTEATADLLDDLASRALLEFVPRYSSRAVLLHDLLRDLLSGELREQQVSAHQSLLGVYHTTCQGTGWHTASDDGYLYDHLAYHLRAAGALNELKALFADQNWLQVRVPQCDYTYDGYLEDLTQAQTVVHEETKQQIEAGLNPSAFADGVRYVLIRASINSLAGNYIAELVAQAVETGLWTPRRALSIAAKIPEPFERARMYILLLTTKKLDKKQQEKAQQEAWKAIQKIEIRTNRLELLTALEPYLTGEQHSEALNAVQTLEREREMRKQMQTRVTPLSEKDQVRYLESIVQGYLNWEGWRGTDVLDQYDDALDELASQSSSESLERALEIVRELDDQWKLLSVRDKEQGGWRLLFARRRLLSGIAPYLMGEPLERGLKATLELENESDRGWILSKLAPRLRGEQLERGLVAAWALKDEEVRVHVLVKFAPQLRGEQLQRCLEGMLVLKDKQLLARMQAWLAQQLPEEQRVWVVERSLEAARAVEDREVLAYLAPYLTKELLGEYMDEVRTLKSGQKWALIARESVEGLEKSEQVQIPANHAPQLSEEQRNVEVKQRLNSALAMEPRDRLSTLSLLAPYLASELLEQYLEEALTFTVQDEEDINLVIEALENFAPYLTGKLVGRCLEVVLNPDWQGRCDGVLVALVPQLTGKFLEQYIEEVLAQPSLDILVALAPKVTGTPFEPRLQAVLTLRFEQHLQALLSSKNDKECANGLVSIAPYFSGEPGSHMVAKYLKAAWELTNDLYRAWALAAYLPIVSDPVSLLKSIRLALACSLKVDENRPYENVLKDYLPTKLFAPPILLPETLSTIMSHILEICEKWQWL